MHEIDNYRSTKIAADLFLYAAKDFGDSYKSGDRWSSYIVDFKFTPLAKNIQKEDIDPQIVSEYINDRHSSELAHDFDIRFAEYQAAHPKKKKPNLLRTTFAVLTALIISSVFYLEQCENKADIEEPKTEQKAPASEQHQTRKNNHNEPTL